MKYDAQVVISELSTAINGGIKDNYWCYRTDGDLNIQYNKCFEKTPWSALKKIVDKVIGSKPITGPGDYCAFIATIDGQPVVAFTTLQDKILVVVIETQAGFEKCTGTKMSDLIVSEAQDGQHKHKGFQ